MGFRQGYISISSKVWNNLKLGVISGRTSKTMCSGGDIASGVCLSKLLCQFYTWDWLRHFFRLENLGEATVQLRERNWRIFSLSGKKKFCSSRKEKLWNYVHNCQAHSRLWEAEGLWGKSQYFPGLNPNLIRTFLFSTWPPGFKHQPCLTTLVSGNSQPSSTLHMSPSKLPLAICGRFLKVAKTQISPTLSQGYFPYREGGWSCIRLSHPTVFTWYLIIIELCMYHLTDPLPTHTSTPPHVILNPSPESKQEEANDPQNTGS